MKRVLVVDEQESGRELVRTILEHAGCVVVEAADGESALALATSQAFDLLVMDLQMPVLDGVEVLRRLQSMPGRNIPAVALTAHAMAEDRERALAAGFADFVSKPVSPSELRSRLLRLVGLTEEERS